MKMEEIDDEELSQKRKKYENNWKLRDKVVGGRIRSGWRLH